MNVRVFAGLMVLILVSVGQLAFLSSPALAQDTAWERAEQIVNRITVPIFPERDFPVTDFGARAGGKVLCTEAFRRAIAACHQTGGGRVVVPPPVRWVRRIRLCLCERPAQARRCVQGPGARSLQCH